MLEGFATVVPTLRGARHGTLRPASHAHCGVVLVEERIVRSPALARVYDELELYLQAAGITSLRLRREPSTGSAALFEVLAGVTTLRSLALERVLVIASGQAPITSTMAASEARDSFLEMVVEHAVDTPEVVQTIHGLIATVRQVADSLVGVATIVSQSPSPSNRRALRVLASPPEEVSDSQSADADAAPRASRALPHRLIVPLPGGPMETAAAISALYTWALAIVRAEGREAVQDTAADPMAADAPGSAAWQEVARWLDEQWLAIGNAFAIRAPERAERAPTLLQAGDGETVDGSMRTARLSWRYLDQQARQEWLSACSQVFATMTERAGVLTQRWAELQAHG